MIESTDSHGHQQNYPLLWLYLLFENFFYVYESNKCVLTGYVCVCVCVCVGLYYLVDSSLPIGTSFLPPHKSTRHHAQGLRLSNRWPTSKKELYNYRHLSLQMVIEQSFGVLKANFLILNLMPNFKRSRHHYVIIVCYALHNFISINNRGDELFSTKGDHTHSKGGEYNNKGNGNTRASSSSAT